MFRQRRTEQVPPEVLEESSKVLSGKTKLIGVTLFFSIVILRQVPFFFGNLVPFGEYLWIIPILLFLVFVIKISSKINAGLEKKGTNIKDAYNQAGDSALFERATKSGSLKTFSFGEIIFLLAVLSFCCFLLIFGILAFYLVLSKGLTAFLMMSLMAIGLGAIFPYLFLFAGKRVLSEAKRRNKFIDAAKKKWSISKKIYVAMICFALLFSSTLIITEKNFVEWGDLYSNGSLVYTGQEYHTDFADCFEASFGSWQEQSCPITFSGKIDIYRLGLQIDKQVKNKALEDWDRVLDDYAVDYCIVNKNPEVFDNLNFIQGHNISTILKVKCNIGGFEYLPEDKNIVDYYCRNHQNCYGDTKICCFGSIE